MCISKVKYILGHISGMVGPINMKRKWSALFEYWLYYVTLSFDLSKSHIEIAGFQGVLVWLMWTEKESELKDTERTVWPCPLTTPKWHWLWNFKVRVWNSLIPEWDGRLTKNEMGVSRPFMIMILTFVWPWWGGVISDDDMSSTFPI